MPLLLSSKKMKMIRSQPLWELLIILAFTLTCLEDKSENTDDIKGFDTPSFHQGLSSILYFL